MKIRIPHFHLWGCTLVKPIYIGTGNCLCKRTCLLCGLEQDGFRENDGSPVEWEDKKKTVRKNKRGKTKNKNPIRKKTYRNKQVSRATMVKEDRDYKLSRLQGISPSGDLPYGSTGGYTLCGSCGQKRTNEQISCPSCGSRDKEYYNIEWCPACKRGHHKLRGATVYEDD